MYRSGRRPNSRCSGCPSRPTEVSRQQPSPGEPVFATHAQADRHAVTLAIAVSEFKFPVFDTGFRHVEGHHADIVPEVPPSVIFLEEAGRDSLMKMAKVTCSLSKGFNRGDDDFAPERRLGRDDELDGRTDTSRPRIKAVEFDVSPRECVPYAEEYE